MCAARTAEAVRAPIRYHTLAWQTLIYGKECFILSLKIEKMTLTNITYLKYSSTVLPAKSDSYVVFCLQSYQGLIIDRSLVY